MTISEVCHQNNECCSYPKDLVEMINDLPTAIVSEGKEVIEDIREGDKSEIIVDLIGRFLLLYQFSIYIVFYRCS